METLHEAFAIFGKAAFFWRQAVEFSESRILSRINDFDFEESLFVALSVAVFGEFVQSFSRLRLSNRLSADVALCALDLREVSISMGPCV